MFVKLTRSGPRTYVQLAESYRDDSGKPRQRTVATLGRVDGRDGQVDAVLRGLLKARGLSVPETPQIRFESALALGHVWALNEIWKELGLDQLNAVFRQARFRTPVELALRVMVFNRLCDPDSKLGVLRWLDTVSFPEPEVKDLTHQQLLRSLDALMAHQDAVHEAVAGCLRPLIDTTPSVVFYDMTTVRCEGLSEVDDDLRRYGLCKEGMMARQFMVGVVQTSDGLPIHHAVFPGSTAEAPTIEAALAEVIRRYAHIRRLVVVADRGLLNLDNIEKLKALHLPDGRTLEFILAVPARRYAEFTEPLEKLQQTASMHEGECLMEITWQGERLIVVHDPHRAAMETARRRDRVAQLMARADELAGKLDAQDEGQRRRGRRLSDSGAKARFYHEVCEEHLTRIIRVDLKSELFTYEVDETALHQAEVRDGKLLLVTNVKDLTPQEILERYKSLADIERGFRVLKSEIEIAPVYHRLPERIRAHAAVCFLALILYRVMRSRLKQAGLGITPETALRAAAGVQRHHVTVGGGSQVQGISTLTSKQREVFKALHVHQPTAENTQMSLL